MTGEEHILTPPDEPMPRPATPDGRSSHETPQPTSAPSPLPHTDAGEDALFGMPLEENAPAIVHAAPSADTTTGVATVPDPAAPRTDSASHDAGTPVDASAPAGTDAVESQHEQAPAQGAETDLPRPDTTAEIDVTQVEAQLNSPGSTQSFTAITEDRIETDSTYDAGTSTALMWGARSDVGCVRTHNEDSYLVQSPLFCVCDGMGGHAAGEVASSIAVETLAKLAPHEADPARLAAAVEAANAAIIEAAENGLGKPGMGCTATAAYVEGTTMAIAHVGDSRAYLLHEGTLIRITRDHSYVEELVDAGEITADEARVHPNRSVITRALGSDPALYADHFQINIEEGDRLILCSDGLSSMIPDAEIESIATQSPTAQICTDNLVDAALAAGGNDNVTVVVVDVVDDGRIQDLTRRRRRNILIAVVGLIVALALAFGIGAFVVLNSVFLGESNGYVAIYRGVPDTFMGIDLYSLYDETAIDLDDLPEDTQNRLQAGIRLSSMDEARDTIAQYWNQIDANQTRAAQEADKVAESTDAESEDDASEAEESSGDSETTGTSSAQNTDTSDGSDDDADETTSASASDTDNANSGTSSSTRSRTTSSSGTRVSPAIQRAVTATMKGGDR